MLIIFLFIIGAAMGSFANALTWRLKNKRDFVRERSECEHCHHELAAKDLVPILSWMSLKGKCRYCNKDIGVAHVAAETATGLLFVVSYLLWPHGVHGTAAIAQFTFLLAYLVGVVALGIYDIRWQLLPDKIVFTLIFLGILGTLVGHAWLGHEGLVAVVNAGAGITVFAGFLGLLFIMSRGRWIGLGDVKLAIFLGMVLGMPASLVGLLGSYYIGAIIMTPLLLAKKVSPQSQVAFGPFLLASFWLAFFFGEKVVHWFTTISLFS
jgi:prepilin signal peptidase PulO-like enzyme (type II secretory pathway)